MNRRTYWLLSVLVIVSVGSVFVSGAMGHGDEREDQARWKREWKDMPRAVAAVTNDHYANECGACHIAYPPGLLPSRSWNRVMAGLEDHFGDDASLPPETAEIIAAYLDDNASDRAGSRIGAKIGRSIGLSEAPLRISETAYFQRKHDEVPQRMVRDNPKVKSFANCAACHRQAESGVFDEHDVQVAGFEQARF
ncbi:MAG: diheme cytochrome c [Chromatiales bacterium]|jgi:cytochrome c553|nr:diheme cytochrome c [Chromatiales bacterium]MDX9765758.1 diheme cytochrome c [Ectothiorhodospiraceae bacterium]